MPYANAAEARAALHRALMRTLEEFGWSTTAHDEMFADLVDNFEFGEEVILPDDE